MPSPVGCDMSTVRTPRDVSTRSPGTRSRAVIIGHRPGPAPPAVSPPVSMRASPLSRGTRHSDRMARSNSIPRSSGHPGIVTARGADTAADRARTSTAGYLRHRETRIDVRVQRTKDPRHRTVTVPGTTTPHHAGTAASSVTIHPVVFPRRFQVRVSSKPAARMIRCTDSTPHAPSTDTRLSSG